MADTEERRGTLLEAILENPESDDARLVYADQLLSKNDPRGEYIQLDIALAGPLSIRKREELAARRKQLLNDHSASWWPYSASHWRTHKGFIASVSGTWAQIQAIAPALFAAEPVTEVSISAIDDIADLLDAPWLPRIQRLILRSIDDDDFVALCESPNTKNLRALNVTANELGAGAFASISDALPRCTNLVLTGNEIGDDGLEVFCNWKQLANVDTLYLSNCGLGDISQLWAKRETTKLAKLTLSDNYVGDSAANTIAKCAERMPALEHLEMTRCGLTASGAKAIAEASLPTLRRIDVRYNNLPTDLVDEDARFRV